MSKATTQPVETEPIVEPDDPGTFEVPTDPTPEPTPEPESEPTSEPDVDDVPLTDPDDDVVEGPPVRSIVGAAEQ